MARKLRSHKHHTKHRDTKPTANSTSLCRSGLSVQIICGAIAFALFAVGSLAQWHAMSAPPKLLAQTATSKSFLPKLPAHPASSTVDELPPESPMIEPPLVYPTMAGYNAYTSGGLPPGALPAGVVLPGISNPAMPNPNAAMSMMPTIAQGGRTTAQGYGVYDGVRQQFTGKERDNETGLDYFGARYHSPVQGRFTSVDPENASADLEDPQSWNEYAYARNNPLKYVDRDGRQFEICAPNGDCFKHDDKDFYNYRKLFGGSLQGGRNSGNLLDGEGNVIGTYRRLDYDNPVEGLVEQFNRYPVKSAFGALYGASVALGTGAGGALYAAGGTGTATTLGLGGAATARKLSQRLAQAASAADRNGLTKAGRALQKHMDRPGSAYGTVPKNPNSLNSAGKQIVDDILNNPGSTFTPNKFGGTTVRSPDGKGISFNSDGSFRGFLEP